MSERCIRGVRVWAAVALVALCVVPAGATARRSAASAPFVPCVDIIGQTSGPRVAGYRLVLGVMSVPPAYIYHPGAVAVHGAEFGRWTYWRKAGMIVREGNFTVTVSVPRAWRSRAAITWGNGQAIVPSLRFTGCGNGAPTNTWNGYAGGFLLRESSACMPLVFRMGQRSETVRFGIGQRWKPGVYGRGIERELPPDLSRALADAHGSFEATADLFRRAARDVGVALGYAYPQYADDAVTAYFDKLA